MRAFLEAGKDRIRRAGFKPTIGFALRDTLRRSGITTEITQFHHYPAGSGTLAPHTLADPGFPAIIGEFATATNDIWPELADSGQSVLHRLRLAAGLGYSMAMPWSFLSRDRHTSWAAVEADLKVFVEEQAAASDRA